MAGLQDYFSFPLPATGQSQASGANAIFAQAGQNQLPYGIQSPSGGTISGANNRQPQYQQGGWYDNPATGKNQRFWNGQFLPVGQTDPINTTSGGNSNISSGNSMESYISQLQQQLYGQLNSSADQMLAGLEPQKASQEQIITNSYNQSLSDLQAQREQGLADLVTQERKTGESQIKNLNDLTGNLRNMFSAGQTYLGARGAADSSAANQYSYAIAQLGNKNRADILSQSRDIYNDIGDRRAKLQNVYTQESSRLATEKSNQLLQVGQWYQDAQNQIRQTKSANSVQLGQAVLNQAISFLNQINQNNQVKNQVLQTWAANNAKSIEQLTVNLRGISGYMAPPINPRLF